MPNPSSPRRVSPGSFSIGKTLRAVVLCLVAAPAFGQGAPGGCESGEITAAAYTEPTGRYPHGALGDELEWGAMQVGLGCASGPRSLTIRLPQELVFEDLFPRLWDVTGDGSPEIVVVESAARKGARLTIWGLRNGALERLASTPHIGTRFRWLAPLAAGDLDGDGKVEIAYVDRPHLAKVLRVWRYDAGQLTEIAQLPGLTNHLIGAEVIHGGLRDCGDGPELFLADGGWRRLQAVSLKDGALNARDIGPLAGEKSWEDARTCG